MKVNESRRYINSDNELYHLYLYDRGAEQTGVLKIHLFQAGIITVTQILVGGSKYFQHHSDKFRLQCLGHPH